MTVDRDLVAAANDAVATGRAESLSGWVNQALAEQIAKERKLRAMADAVATHEAEYGAISEAELALQARADRAAAVVVRGRRRSRKARAGRKKS